MRILLAPMEGVVDHTMRQMLTKLGGIDRCVTEFIRVTNTRLPNKVFLRYCPELNNGGLTEAGVPVYVQLLGGNPEMMAINALQAAKLGAPGIDINFGCPAKLVNKNDGGSVILKQPNRVYDIISAVRNATPHSTPITAKIRLGFEDRSLLHEICQAVFEANTSELTIHARTKVDGYKPPAYWDAISDIRERSPIPIIANGEIWSIQDYQSCIKQSQCTDIMLGRGILACPDLAMQIKAFEYDRSHQKLGPQGILELLAQFSEITEAAYENRYVGNRVKQWLGYLRRQYPLASELFEDVKRLTFAEDISEQIQRYQSRMVSPVSLIS